MELSVEKIGDVSVAVVPGETLDAGCAKDFKAAAAPLLTPGAKVIFDLSGLRFVDSSGLGALLSCLRQLNAAGGDLKLSVPANPCGRSSNWCACTACSNFAIPKRMP